MVLIFHDELISSQELHPLLRSPPYDLTLSVIELTTPKVPKERHDNSTDPEEDVIIPRPHNAFIIFRNDYAAKMKSSEKKVSIRLISQMASKKWKQESEIVKLFFKVLSDMYQHKHRILYPDYKYSPRLNSARKSKRKSNKAKTKNGDSNGKKKGRIITWYIHDNTDKDLRTEKTNDTFRHTDLNICNPGDAKIEPLSFKQRNYPPATFINYTATPTTPLVLHSTTTTCSPPVLPPINLYPYDINSGNSLPFYDNNNNNNNITNDNNDNGSDSASSYYDDNALSPLSFIPIEPMETLSPRSSPPSDECLFWTEHPNNNERDVPFGLSLFDNQTIFDI